MKGISLPLDNITKPDYLEITSISPNNGGKVDIDQGASKDFVINFKIKNGMKAKPEDGVKLKFESDPTNQLIVPKMEDTVLLKDPDSPFLVTKHLIAAKTTTDNPQTVNVGAIVDDLWSGIKTTGEKVKVTIDNIGEFLTDLVEGAAKEGKLSFNFTSPVVEGTYPVSISGIKDNADNPLPTIHVGNLVVEEKPDKPTNPDESLDVYDSSLTGQKATPFGTVKIAIIKSGYWAELKDLLAVCGEAADYVAPQNFTPSLVQKYPILLIPSAGLSNLSTMPGFRDKLTEYVSAGGTLVVLTQPTDDCYQLLPGQVESLGYFQDKACYTATAGIRKYNHALAGQADVTVNGTADGVLTSWPVNAETWLYRIKNNFPALLSYPAGQGRVIVSNYYSDYAHGHSQLHEDERRLLRDLLSWGRNFGELPEVQPGGKITVNVPVRYAPAPTGATLAPAAKVKLILRTPDRKTVQTEEIASDLVAGSEVVLPLEFNDIGNRLSANGTNLGIWWINYEILDVTGQVVQAEYEGQRVALSKHLMGQGGSDLSLTVNPELTSALEGTPIPFRIIGRNDGDASRNIGYKIFAVLGSSSGQTTQEQEVGSGTLSLGSRAGSEITVELAPFKAYASSMLLSWAKNWWRFEFRDETGQIVVQELRGIGVYKPAVRTHYDLWNQTTQNATVHKPGDQIRLNYRIENLVPVGFPVAWDLTVKAVHQEGRVIHQQSGQGTLDPVITDDLIFTIPDNCTPDTYLVDITVRHNDAAVPTIADRVGASDNSLFALMIDNMWLGSDGININLHNYGSTYEDYNIICRFNGARFIEEHLNGTINGFEILQLVIPIKNPALFTPNSSISCYIVDPVSGKELYFGHSFRNQVKGTVKSVRVDKPTNRLIYDLTVENQGPSISGTQLKVLSSDGTVLHTVALPDLAVGQTIDLPTEVLLPAEPGAGFYPIQVVVYDNNHPNVLHELAPKLELTASKASNQGIKVEFTNNGVLDADYQYNYQVWLNGVLKQQGELAGAAGAATVQERLIAVDQFNPFAAYNITGNLTISSSGQTQYMNKRATPFLLEVNSRTLQVVNNKLQYDFQIENTGSTEASNIKFVMETAALGFQKAMEIPALAPGETTGCQGEYVLPEGTLPGTYQLTYSLLNTNGAKTTPVARNYTVSAPRLNIAGPSKTQFIPGEQYTLTLTNQGDSFTRVSYELFIKDQRGIKVAEQSGITDLNPNQIESLMTAIDAEFASAQYFVHWKVTTAPVATSLNGYQTFMVKGAEASLSVATDRNVYRTDQNVLAQARPVNGSQPVDGNLELSVQKLTRTPGERIDQWPCIGGNNQRTGFAKLSGNITQPSVRWARDWDIQLVGDVDGDNRNEAIEVTDYGISIFDGSTGLYKFSPIYKEDLYPQYTGYSGITASLLTDIDGNGTLEVIVCWNGCLITVINGKGQVVWLKQFDQTVLSSKYMAAADLDSDVIPELILDNLVLNAATGDIKREDAQLGTIGDVDDDGKIEIVTPEAVLDQDFKVVALRNGGVVANNYPILADLNQDGFLEIVSFDANALYVYSHDYKLLWMQTIKGIQKVVCGDVNRDSYQEIIAANCDGTNQVLNFNCYADRGTKLWESHVDYYYSEDDIDVVLNDIDGDGNIELLFGDNIFLNILSGEGILKSRNFFSWFGLFNKLIIADIDGDRQSEIIGNGICLDNFDSQKQEPEIVIPSLLQESVKERYYTYTFFRAKNGTLFLPGNRSVFYYVPAENRKGLIPITDSGTFGGYLLLDETDRGVEVKTSSSPSKLCGIINPDTLVYSKIGSYSQLNWSEFYSQYYNGKYYNIIDDKIVIKESKTGEIMEYKIPSLLNHDMGIKAIIDDNNVIVGRNNISNRDYPYLYRISLNNLTITKVYSPRDYTDFCFGSVRMNSSTIVFYGYTLLTYNIHDNSIINNIPTEQLVARLGYASSQNDSLYAVKKDENSIYLILNNYPYLYCYDFMSDTIAKVADIYEYSLVSALAKIDSKIYYTFDLLNDGIWCYDKATENTTRYVLANRIKALIDSKNCTPSSKIYVSPDKKLGVLFNSAQQNSFLILEPESETWQWFDFDPTIQSYDKICFGNSPDELYVFNEDKLLIYNFKTNTIKKSHIITNLPDYQRFVAGVAYDRERGRVYYIFSDDSIIGYLDLKTETIHEIADPQMLYSDLHVILIGASGDKLYFANPDSETLWQYSIAEKEMSLLSHSNALSYTSEYSELIYDFYDSGLHFFDPNELKLYSYNVDFNLCTLNMNPIHSLPSNNDIYDYTGTTFHEEAVAQTVLPVSLAPGESKELNHDFDAFTDPGTYTLKGRLSNQNGQLLAEGRSQFIVNNSGLGVMVNASRSYFRPGENFTIDGELLNTSTTEAGGLKLTVTKNGSGQTTVVKEEELALRAGENRPYQLSFTADASEGQYLIEAKLEQNGVLMAQSQCLFEVVKPALTIEAETPGTVGSQPFDVRLKLANTCPLPLELQLNSSLLQLAGPLSLAANESTEVIRQLTLSSDAILDVSVTGDLTQQYQREIRYAASVATISLPERLSDVVKTIPYNLFNPSQIQGELKLNLTLYRDGQLVSEEILPFLLNPAQSLQGDWPVNLTPGNYRLVYSWGNQRRELTFVCLPESAATMTVISENLSPDQIKLTIQTANQGYQDISGTLEIRSDFTQQALPITLVARAEETTEITLENLPATPGNYEIKITFLQQDRLLAEETVTFTREVANPLAPEMILEAEIATAIGGAGQELSVTVTVKNNGTKAGDAIVELNAEPLTAEPAVLNVQPEASETVSFQLMVPDDYESGTYQGKALINGTAYPFQYQVNGYKLQAEAALNKTAYQNGEVATLVLNAQNLGGQSELPLTVRVKHGEFDETREIVINDAASLVFAVPAEDFNQKIFYGFYHSHTGRSLFLNVHNIYEALPELSLTTDKQTYQAGETVQVSVTVNQEGWLALTGPGDFYRFEKVSGVAAYAMPLPAGLRTGTYSIWAAFAEKTVEYRIDVRGGADLRFVSGKLDQNTYRKNQPFQLDVIVNSGSALNCTATLELVRPDGTVDGIVSQAVNLIAGENAIQFKGVINSSQAGTHWMRVKLLDGDRPLSVQKFAFQCGQEELLAITTGAAQYVQGNEPVTGELHLYGAGSGTVIVSLDGTHVLTVPATLNGTTTVPFIISGGIRPGQHQLTAVYQGAGTTGTVSAAFDYGIGLPDLQVQNVVVEKERTAAGAIPIQITIRKGRALPATEIPVSVKIGEQQIATYTIPALTEENESHQQTVLWDSGNFQGAGTVTVDVNPQRSIKEYDDQNNTGAARFLIPKIPEAGGLPAVTNDPNLRITGSATPESLVLLYNGRGIVDFGFADSGGSFTLANVVLAQGENKLRFMAKSNDGWTSLFSPEFQVIVDAAPPEISAANLSDGQHLNYEVIPEIIITEENPVEITYLLDNQPWTPGTTVASEGIHQLWVQVSDLAGNQTQLALTFTIDRTPPEVTIDGVADGFFYNLDVTPLITASDLNPLIVESALNGEPYQGGLITADGVYQLTVAVTDQAGNTTDQFLEFVVDQTKPVIQVTGIVPDGANQAPVTPQIEIVEANLAETDLWLDSKPYKIGAAIPEPGWHELTISASDKAGNSETVTVRFEIGNQPSANLDYAILCQGLQVQADVKIQSIMAFGPVAFVDGDSRIDYLGTSEAAVERNKQTKITKIETNLPLQSLPKPDWTALDQATQLRTESKITTKITMSNVRFENDLLLENDQMKVTGLLVVKGDLTLKGEMKFNPIAIFCTGKVTIISDAHVTGLIYAGGGVLIDGDSKVNGMIVSNAGVTVLGDLRCQKQETPYDGAWWSR